MKNKLYIGGIIAAFMAGSVLMNSNIIASSVIPGTASDPVVSQSYVDQKYNQLLGMINAGAGTGGAAVSKDDIIKEVMAQLEFYYGGQLTASSDPFIRASNNYTPVSVVSGQIVIGGEGSEIILRSGSAKGYCPGANGIVNATTGQEIYHNTSVAINNLLIVPRDDGRGLKATSDCWLLIKGDYEVLK